MFTDFIFLSYCYADSVEGDEMGSRSTLSCETDREVDRGDGHWEMNYHESAIFLEASYNNDTVLDVVQSSNWVIKKMFSFIILCTFYISVHRL